MYFAIKILIALILALFSFQSFAQEPDQYATEEAFRNLVLGVTSDSLELLQAFPKNVLCNTENSPRRWKETLDLSIDEDKAYYDILGIRIRDMASDPNYKIAAFAKERMGKNDWYTLRVEYISAEDNTAKVIFFSFFKLNGKLLLADLG